MEILAFPCDQFGGQELATPEEIRSFTDGYNVKFNMMGKVDVNGGNTDPVYKLLKGSDGADITWNFATKFLVKCAGPTCDVYRYDGANPSDMEKDIKTLLGSR